MEEHQGKVQIIIDSELEDLIPGFLTNRAVDVENVIIAVNEGDFEKIRIVGHTMKGVGGGYGFDYITSIGGDMEVAAKDENTSLLLQLADELKNYLARVDIIYK